MELIGYICAVIVGVSLGVLGAGGSILTIPILIYLFKIDPLHATTYAFFIVGTTALVGAIENIRKGNVQIMPAIYFAITGSIVIYIIRNYVLHNIPDVLFSVYNIIITKDIFILLFFAVVMAIAGISMILQSRRNVSGEKTLSHVSVPKLIALGFLVGVIVAFAGVGGGFLITPALTLFAGQNIKKAIGTSLCIISLNSFTGFFSSFHLHDGTDWGFLFLFVLLTGAGVFAGMYITRRIDSMKMKRIFGWFVLAMSVFILAKELFLKM
ncbi:MAG: sulfite exporter TauE/SafE family protein [Chitinophagales bacterium]